MVWIVFFILLLRLPLQAVPLETSSRPSRVVLVSIDGLRPVHYIDKSWPAPCLQSLLAKGAASSGVEPVFPSITYANHTSLVTGRRPASHGIDCNIDFDWKRGPLAGWNWESSRIQSVTLWDLARARGLKTAAFSWPVTVGAPIDFLVPEIFSVPGANEGTTEELLRAHSTPGLIDRIQQGAEEDFPQDFAAWDRWLPRAVGRVWQEEKVDLTLIHMLNLDWTQHRFGPDSSEVSQALEQLDQALARIVAQIDFRDTLLCVVGDHGFLPVERTFCPNRLFWEKGWITLVGGQIRSWRVIARSNGGSAAIYIKDPALVIPVRQLLERQAPDRWQVLCRQRLDRLHTFKGAALALNALPGNALSGQVQAPFESRPPRTLGQHGHMGQWVPTGWIMVGPDVQPGLSLGKRHLLEVAPTVCRWLGIAADGMESSGLPRPLKSKVVP